MITFVGLDFGYKPKDGPLIVDRTGVKVDLSHEMLKVRELRIVFKSGAANKSMNLVATRQKKVSQVGSVLPVNSCDEGPLHIQRFTAN